MAIAFNLGTARRLALAALALAAVVTDAPAQGFFGEQQPFASNTFFGQPFGTEPAPRPRVYIRKRAEPVQQPQNAYCVRTCDGRFFPYPAGRNTDVKACDALCPSTEMKLYSGADIKSATSEKGKPYEKLANAFRFQREIVADCTCNAKVGFGMTPISVRNDRTLRSGDIIAEAEGLMVATVTEGSSRRPGRMMFRPLSDANARLYKLPRASLR